MSVLSCATFILILLAILENACCTRPGVFDAVAATVQDEDASDRSNLLNKKDGLKINLTDAKGMSKRQVASSTVKKSSLDNDIVYKQEEVNVMATRHIRHKHTNKKKNSHQCGTTKAITYMVPQKNQEDQQQSFTLDYSPPKVHPPHHN